MKTFKEVILAYIKGFISFVPFLKRAKKAYYIFGLGLVTFVLGTSFFAYVLNILSNILSPIVIILMGIIFIGSHIAGYLYFMDYLVKNEDKL